MPEDPVPGDVKPEPLLDSDWEVWRFKKQWTPAQFVALFCEHKPGSPGAGTPGSPDQERTRERVFREILGSRTPDEWLTWAVISRLPMPTRMRQEAKEREIAEPVFEGAYWGSASLKLRDKPQINADAHPADDVPLPPFRAEYVRRAFFAFTAIRSVGGNPPKGRPGARILVGDPEPSVEKYLDNGRFETEFAKLREWARKNEGGWLAIWEALHAEWGVPGKVK